VKFKKYLLFLLFTIFINNVWSQTNFYFGGTSGSGTGMSAMLTASACTPTYDTTLLFYRGGNYGSYGNTLISGTACPTRIDSTISFYRGGNYGSYGSTLISATTCPFFLDSTISFYRGGNYGSYGNTKINASLCLFSLDSSLLIFRGGNYGAYGTTLISASTCPLPDPINIWAGGASSTNNALSINNNTSNNTSGPFISTIADTTIINGNCITLSTSGIGATSYSWSPSNGLSDPNIANPVANPTTTTIYTVTGTGSSAGCRNQATVIVNVNNNNGATSISYPSQISTAITTVQNVALTGITNGVFTANSANLKINASNGAITPNTSSVGTYVVTYTYGICNNTVTTNVTITADATDHGEVVYPNFYMGATSGLLTPSVVVTQSSCTIPIDYTLLLYRGGTTEIVAANKSLIQGACTALIDYTTVIYAGGTTGANTPKAILSQSACTPYVNPSNTIYMGGTTGANTPRVFLNNAACTVPAGTNFYIGGSGTGYGNGSLSPSTSANNGTAVATRSDTTICPGTPIVLSSRGATNYTWTPATGLDNTLNPSPTATPITTTTYTVVGSGAGVGCINTAKVTITVLKDTLTNVSYGAYNFDETDMRVKKVNYIIGPLTGTFTSSPSGLEFNPSNGSFTPGLSTSGVYAINYNYTKGACNYTYVSNINITTLPPSITYPSPSVFYINYDAITVSPTNSGGRAIAYEAMDALPTGLTINASTGVISGTPVALVENASVRIRAYNLNKLGGINYSDIYTMTIAVRKPIISSTTSSIASMNTTYGSASSENIVNVSGQYIIQNIVVTPPTGFEVSRTTGTGFANTVTITQSGGNIASTNIYLRIKNNAAVGNLTGTVLFRSQAADDLAITLATSYVAPAPLTIAARYFQKFYGSKIVLGAGNSNFIATGLKNNETIGSITLTAAGGTAANDVPGLYAITPSAAIGGSFSSANYNINYTAAQFEVLYSLYGFTMSGSTSNWVQGKVPIPKISGGVISLITNTSARYTASIPTSFANIIQRGVCWNTTMNPTIGNNKVIDGATTTGSLTANLTGLTSGTTYYIRTYITVGSFTYYGPNVKFVTSIANDGSSIAKAAVSGVQLRADFPSLTSGWYYIKSASMPNALEMYVDMTEDGGGYDFYLIKNGTSVSSVTETNSGTALGLDLVMPRSTGHWKAMSNAVIAGIARGASIVGSGNYASFFQTTYGVYRTTNAGNGGGDYTNKVLRHSSYGGTTNAADWRVKDGGKWWLRDNAHSEPNGDYNNNGLLGLHAGGYTFPNPYDYSNIGFNDGGAYSTGQYYLVSTNTKQ
jgi:hypothetical protein